MTGTAGLGLDATVAAVTGGARGIDRACVLGLARHGAHVVSLDVDRSASDGLAAEAVDLPGRVVTLVGDADSPADLERVIAVAATLGGLDAAVNVVGSPGRPGRPAALGGPTLDMDPDHWNAVVTSTMFSPFLGSQAFGRAIIDAGRPGAIVNIGASLGLRGGPPPITPHSPPPKPVSTSSPSPWPSSWPPTGSGSTASPRCSSTPRAPGGTTVGRRALLAAAIPLGRVATADDVAGVVLFLVSRSRPS